MKKKRKKKYYSSEETPRRLSSQYGDNRQVRQHPKTKGLGDFGGFRARLKSKPTNYARDSTGTHHIETAGNSWVVVGFFLTVLGLAIALASDKKDGRVEKTWFGCLLWILVPLTLFVLSLLGTIIMS